MKIALAQTNPTVGDIAGNSAKIAEAIERAQAAGARLVVFPELSVTGYPPRDLLRKEQFIADNLAAAEALARRCTKIAALVGYVRPTPKGTGRPLQNVAGLLEGGRIRHVHVKSLLPTYDVFDETRYFQPGPSAQCVEVAGCTLGLSICEDLWDAVALGRELYGREPIAELTAAGAQVIVNMAASPYQMGKAAQREDLFARQAARSRSPLVYVNQVGGNDELIFDGASCLVAADGRVLARAASFREDLLVVDSADGGRTEPLGEEMARLSGALKLGLADYVHKCGFAKAVLGLSGGIDSAVVAVLAAEALGPGNVLALAMPSRYSSPESLEDAQAVAKAAGIELRVLPIEPVHLAYGQVLGETMPVGACDATEENIQARIRGNLIMAHSNRYGGLALATGNKSELSTGYCTLYGDMAGALSPIGDVLKTVVYKLAEQLNAEGGRRRIPQRVFDKPPSAELKPNQRDQDKLPPYDVLDEVLKRYIEQDRTAEQIIAEGFDGETVRRVVAMVDAAEFKRRQASPVLKVTSRAFGSGRRMPIAQRYTPSR
jgi:NAD+ synthase (glutamine-hydrolysing)